MTTTAHTLRLKLMNAILTGAPRHTAESRTHGAYGASTLDRVGAPRFVRILSHCRETPPETRIVVELEKSMPAVFRVSWLNVPPVSSLVYDERWPERLQQAYRMIVAAYTVQLIDMQMAHEVGSYAQLNKFAFRSWQDLEQKWAPAFVAWQCENGVANDA